MTFPQFLDRKFLEFQQGQGGRRTVAEFAAFIGVKQSTLSIWWNSGSEPSGESVRLLAEKLGLEVYDVLELDRPDEDLYYIQQHWDDLTPELRRSLRVQAEKYRTKNDAARTQHKRKLASA